MDLAGVDCEDPRAVLPDECECRLLHGELSGETVEAGHDDPVGDACRNRVECADEPKAVGGLESAGDRLVHAGMHDPVSVRLGPGADRPSLGVEPVPF